MSENETKEDKTAGESAVATNAAAGDQPVDHGTRQTREKKGFSVAFMRDWRARATRPEEIVVAGDPATAQGVALAGTFLDDGRANLRWSDEHEQIVMGFLTGSSIQHINEVLFDEHGEPVVDVDDAGQPRVTKAGNPVYVYDHFDVMISDGQPELVFLQGHCDDKGVGEWWPVMHDGRQRKVAAEELQRRLDWCAALINLLGDAGKSKPGRRNLLIRIGTLARGTEKTPGKSWAEILAELAGQLPADAPQYTSPKVGTSLSWLTDTFAACVVGSDVLGDRADAKRGWLQTVKGEAVVPSGAAGTGDGGTGGGEGGTDAATPVATVHRSIVRAYPVWLRVSCIGTNVDPSNPRSLLDGVASKEAQVPTRPSLLAEQVGRILDVKESAEDPNSKPLYDRAAVRAKFGWGEDTLQRYALLLQMCPEVQALIDDGKMSMNFALGKRESAFVEWPKKGERTAIPWDKQRLILSHLLLDLGEDGSGDDVRFRGEEAMRIATKIRNKCLDGKLDPVGSDEPDLDDGGAETVGARPSIQPTVTAGEPAGVTTPGNSVPVKPKKARLLIDVAAFREHAGRAIDAIPGGAAAHGATQLGSDFDRINLARALGLVLCGAEPVSMLAAWPAVRDIVVASMAQVPGAPGEAVPDETSLILDWICVATEEMSLSDQDLPVVTEATNSHGRKPTAGQVERCAQQIKLWVDEFRAPGQTEVNLLDEWLLKKCAAETLTI